MKLVMIQARRKMMMLLSEMRMTQNTLRRMRVLRKQMEAENLSWTVRMVRRAATNLSITPHI